MGKTRIALVLGTALGCVCTVALAGPERIDFPHDYKSTFTQYHSGERQNGEQYAVVFANEPALEGARQGAPLPVGSQLVMEVYKPKLDDGGEVMRDSAGEMVPGDLAAVAVMEKRAGWGDAYPDDLRNGDWDYGLFSQSGDIKKDDATPCLECHLPYAEDSYLQTFSQLVAKAYE